MSKYEVDDWTVKDAGLMNEMKKNCLEGGLYKDEKAEEKFKMLCHLEDYCIGYYILLENTRKAINYIDQVIMYKPTAKELDKELNKLIGILGGYDEEENES